MVGNPVGYLLFDGFWWTEILLVLTWFLVDGNSADLLFDGFLVDGNPVGIYFLMVFDGRKFGGFIV